MPPELRAAAGARRARFLLLVMTTLLLAAGPGRADDFQGATHLMPFDEDTIAYSKTKAHGSIPTLQEKIPFATKQAILEILVDTKPDLPANWKS